jgi:hypothetical protein
MLELKKETIQTEQGKIVPKMPSFWIPSYVALRRRPRRRFVPDDTTRPPSTL